MNVEFISVHVASLVIGLVIGLVMSIVTFCVSMVFVVSSIQSRPGHLAETIPVQLKADDQRAFMVAHRVGNRPVPQENDE